MATLPNPFTQPYPTLTQTPQASGGIPLKDVKKTTVREEISKVTGWTGKKLELATAIALAESGGRISVTNTNKNHTVDRGLFQINSVHSQYDANKLLTDVDYNIRAARAISANGTNWTPWATFNNGSYRNYLGKDGPLIGDVKDNTNNILGAAKDGANAILDVAKAPLKLAQAVIELIGWFFGADAAAHWLRVAKVLGGIFLTGYGMVVIAENTKTGQAITKAVAIA